MSFATILASIDNKLRPLLSPLPSSVYAALYSYTRPWFSNLSANDTSFDSIPIPSELTKKLWGIQFRSPIGNAAGMYKYAEGYERAYKQGAGFYLAGTTTSLPRKGNKKAGIKHPFMPYPHSHAASNWMGLPNLGHHAIAKKIKSFHRYESFPIGASVSADPGMDFSSALQGLIDGMKMYADAGCNFLELNESCPNVEHHAVNNDILDKELLNRLDAIHNNFIKQSRSIPVIVKLSNDTALHQVPAILAALIERGFAGVNFGNTSTQYAVIRKNIDPKDYANYDYFTSEFGGGLSGSVVRNSSVELCEYAYESMCDLKNENEFHIISTGGIETGVDVWNSEKAGASLMQWYTGYFEQYGISGNNIYADLYKEIMKL